MRMDNYFLRAEISMKNEKAFDITFNIVEDLIVPYSTLVLAIKIPY